MPILHDECKPTREAARRLVRGLTHQRAEQTCTHPTEHIRDFPDGSVCRKCGESVPPLMRDSAKSVFPVFPSADNA